MYVKLSHFHSLVFNCHICFEIPLYPAYQNHSQHMSKNLNFILKIGNPTRQKKTNEIWLLECLFLLPDIPSDNSISIWQSIRVHFHFMGIQYWYLQFYKSEHHHKNINTNMIICFHKVCYTCFFKFKLLVSRVIKAGP